MKETDMQQQTFAGFINGLRLRHDPAATRLNSYAKTKTDGKREIRLRIATVLHGGVIDLAEHDRLENCLAECWDAYLNTGRLVDVRDPKDWQSLRNGARKHKKHKEAGRDEETGGTERDEECMQGCL
jgi:hypothetical protein